MLLLLLLPILSAGFLICKKSPTHYYRLHRYEGQMLYLKSATLGLACTIGAYFIVALLDSYAPASAFGFSLNVERWLIELTQTLLNASKKNAQQVTWIILITLVTLFIALLWVRLDKLILHLLGKKHDVDASIIVMGRVLADSPLDVLLYESFISEDKLVMLSLSNRKVYVGVVNNMGEPNEVEGFDQEISLVPILSGYRDKDDLTIHWSTAYKDVDPEETLRIVIRQELIESASEFDFTTWEAFNERRKAKQAKIKVTYCPSKNTLSWNL